VKNFIVLIFATLFLISCDVQNKAQLPTTKFTSFSVWTEGKQSYQSPIDTSIFLTLENRVISEDMIDVQYYQDSLGTNEIEVSEGKITAFIIFTSDSTGITYAR
jgi:hypothetical protein